MQHICEVDIFCYILWNESKDERLPVLFFSEIMVKWLTDGKEELPAVIKEIGKWVGLFFLLCELHHPNGTISQKNTQTKSKFYLGYKVKEVKSI